MNNKDRNQKILDLTCEFLDKLQIPVKDAYVEDLDPAAAGGDETSSLTGEQVLVSITADNPGNLIGFRGKNLASLQLILSLMVKKKLEKWIRVVVDVNNYRSEQKRRLEEMTINLAKKVAESGKEAVMMPMSSFERRICHMAAVTVEGVVSESEGEDEERHVVIKARN